MRRITPKDSRKLGRRARVALLALLGPLGSGAAAPGQAPTFSEIVDVKVINLEVVVTRGGERVGGLGVEDFELRVDGKRIPIEYFTEVAQGLPVAPASRAGGPSPAAVTSLSPGEVVGTRYLVFIDDFFAVPSHRDRVLRALRDDLELLGPADRMAVVAYDGRRIELLSAWSSSTAELAAALEAAEQRTAYGLRRQSELRRLGAPLSHGQALDGSYSSRSSFSSIGFLGSWRDGALPELQGGEEMAARTSQVVRAAASTLRGFGQPAERKVMLLLSGGWPAFGTAQAQRLGGRPRGGALVTSPRDRFRVFEPLVDTANLLGYTLYPVELRPATGFRSRDADVPTLGAARLARAEHEVLLADSRDSLHHLADATGGRALEGAANQLALKRAVEDTRSYYWLGFSPRWRGDDASHRVEVKAGKGLRVRTRRDFTDLSRGREVDLMIEGAQLFDRPLPGEGELSASLGTPIRAGRGRLRVPVSLRIRLDQVTLLPRPGGFAATLELRVAARDDDGLTAEIPLVTIEIERPAKPAAGDVETREIDLKLRHKPHELILALYEPATGSFLSRRLELDP